MELNQLVGDGQHPKQARHALAVEHQGIPARRAACMRQVLCAVGPKRGIAPSGDGVGHASQMDRLTALAIAWI